jgi:hypothetical protein
MPGRITMEKSTLYSLGKVIFQFFVNNHNGHKLEIDVRQLWGYLNSRALAR